MRTKDVLYMAVTADEYELPLVVEDSPKHLSERCGVSRDTVRSALYRKSSGKTRGMVFIAVRVPETEGEAEL